MRNFLLIVLVVVAAFYFYLKQKSPAVPEPRPEFHPKIQPPKPKPVVPAARVAPSAPPPVVRPIPVATTAPAARKQLALPYVLEGNLAIVQGDVLVGAITDEKAPEHGFVNIPELKLWPSNVIPYAISPTLPNPDRVRAALEFFSDTNIQFVPFDGQDDAIVFEDSTGICKSYVGRVGGHQPIFLSLDCGPHEIAHEIMHALGFLHEQNRADRDAYIQVNFDNIDDKYRDNFEKLPTEFMKVSGLGDFDFDSLMIYPPMMFAKGNQPTMQSLDSLHKIQPSAGLSKIDVARVNAAYPR